MPLNGYLVRDRSRISSITPGPKERRKKILPIQTFSEEMYVRMYVLDCVEHTPPTPSVPVNLFAYRENVGWQSLGIARCCPLCWIILEPPVGLVLPERSVQLLPKKIRRTQGQKNFLKAGRRGTRSGPTESTQSKLDQIKQFAELEPVTVYDVMESLRVSRSQARNYLEMLVKSGEFSVIRGVGRGNQTSYEKAP